MRTGRPTSSLTTASRSKASSPRATENCPWRGPSPGWSGPCGTLARMSVQNPPSGQPTSPAGEPAEPTQPVEGSEPTSVEGDAPPPPPADGVDDAAGAGTTPPP